MNQRTFLRHEQRTQRLTGVVENHRIALWRFRADCLRQVRSARILILEEEVDDMNYGQSIKRARAENCSKQSIRNVSRIVRDIVRPHPV